MERQLMQLISPIALGKSRKISLLLLMLSASIQAFAEEDTAYLDMDLEQLLQVTVSGSTLREESLKTVPASVTVFTRNQLDMLGVDYLFELLNLVPGFQSVRTGDASIAYTYSNRGRRLGVRAREILLLVDGRVLTDPRAGGADSGLYLYPLANIEKVEIIRGPGSAVYGSGAFTGVINIVSRRKNQLSIAVGSEKRRRADMSANFQRDDLAVGVYGHFYQDAGQHYQIANQTTQDPRQEAVVDLNVEYNNTQLQAFYSYADADDFYVLEKIDDDFNRYAQGLSHLRLLQKFELSDKWKSRISLSYSEAFQKIDALQAEEGGFAKISEPSSNDPLLLKAVLRGGRYSANWHNELDLQDSGNFQFGLEWQHEEELDAYVHANYDLEQLAHNQLPIRYYGDFEHLTKVGTEESRTIASAYSQYIYDLTDQTRLTLGARYDDYSVVGGHVTPRAALVHQLNEHQTIKLLYGEAFRAPAFAETGFINNPVQLGNPDLTYELVKSTELIWNGSWRSFSIGAGIYHNRYVNPISTVLQGTTRNYVNGESESNFGGGIRGDWQVNPEWMLRIGYSQMDDLPDVAFREADQIGMMMLNYSKDDWSWNLSSVFHAQRQYLLTDTELGTLGAYTLANSQLRYQLDKSTSLQLTVKNLLDKDYSTSAQGVGVIGGIPNRGLEWSLGVDWRW
jgi:outer membrane cobalamin receptor